MTTTNNTLSRLVVKEIGSLCYMITINTLLVVVEEIGSLCYMTTTNTLLVG